MLFRLWLRQVEPEVEALAKEIEDKVGIQRKEALKFAKVLDDEGYKSWARALKLKPTVFDDALSKAGLKSGSAEDLKEAWTNAQVETTTFFKRYSCC